MSKLSNYDDQRILVYPFLHESEIRVYVLNVVDRISCVHTFGDFMDYASLRRAKIYMEGKASNSACLLHLYRKMERMVEHPFTLYISTPVAPEDMEEDLRSIQQQRLDTAMRVNEPLLLWEYYDGNCVAPSIGGWHQVTMLDIATFNVIHSIAAGRDKSHDVHKHIMVQAVMQHPLFQYVSFIPTLDVAAFHSFLCNVVDPRFHTHSEHPERSSVLENYMGLTPKIQEAVLRDTSIIRRKPRAMRCWMTRKCWMPGTERNMTQIDRKDPRNFLFRIFAKKSRAGKHVDGLLRGSQQFVRFARGCWLNILATGSPHAGTLFDPQEFFKYSDEVEAYNKYVQQLKPMHLMRL